MENLTGREFGPYRIIEPLGEGGMASVYKAYQANMDREVALKVLPRHFAEDAEFVARFEQEAKVLAKLRHPHILPVHDYGEVDGYTYLVMPFIESGTLINVLHKDPLSLDDIDHYISQVGDALDYAHSKGIIHRDVKPSNVLVDERGNCMLVDFGIAKIVESSSNLTQTGGILGTPAYMAPEQGRGGATDARIDIYALGVILYEMATGRTPFKAETPIAVLVKHINDPLPPPRSLNPNLPPRVEQVILKAMAKDPDDRFATAGEMVKALSAAVEEASRQTAIDDKTVYSSQLEHPTLPGASLDAQPGTPPVVKKGGLPVPLWLIVGIGLVGLMLIVVVGGIALFSLGSWSQSAATTADSPPLEPVQQTATFIAAADKPDQNEPTSTSVTISATNETPTEPASTPTSTSVTTSAANETPTEPASTPTSTSVTTSAANETPTEPASTPTPTSTRTPTTTPTPGPASITLSFGSEGIGPGQFTDARSVAVDNNTGHIYVGEYIGGRVQVFDDTGKFLTQWLVDPEIPLRGMDVDRNGNVFVVQSGLIYKYNGESGELIQELPYEPGWGFDDVVVTADGGLVAPWSYDIVRMNANGEPTLTIPDAVEAQTGSSELDMRLAVDGLGNIYALGTFNNAVLKFGPAGKFIDLFGSGGDGPGTLDSPTAIAVDGQGRVYVSELVGPIKIFDSGGQYIDSINVQGFGMRFNDQGQMFVASRTKVIKYELNLP